LWGKGIVFAKKTDLPKLENEKGRRCKGANSMMSRLHKEKTGKGKREARCRKHKVFLWYWRLAERNWSTMG